MNPEKILLEHLLFNLFTITIESENIIGIYPYGSRLFGTVNEKSDLDYCIVLKDDCTLWNEDMKKYIQYESDDLDLHIMSRSHYLEILNECDDMALVMYYQHNPILRCEVDFTLDKVKLRKSISATANNSYVKAKKKLTVEEGPENLYIGLKSLFHSFRLYDIGTMIAKKESGFIDFGIFGFDNSWVFIQADNCNNDWTALHEKVRPYYNRAASEFRKVAPKA